LLSRIHGLVAPVPFIYLKGLLHYMEENQTLPSPIVEESTDDLFMVPTQSIHDLVKRAIRETDRLYINATGITDSLARRVITGLATDILTTLRTIGSTLPAEVVPATFHQEAEAYYTEPVGSPWEKAQAIADELENADLEGWN